MDEPQRQFGIEILRDRWEARVALCSTRLSDHILTLQERLLIEREKLTYEIILHEFISRLGLPTMEQIISDRDSH